MEEQKEESGGSKWYPLFGAVTHSFCRWLPSDILTTEKYNANASPDAKNIMIYCIHGTADRPGSFCHIIDKLEFSDNIKGIKSLSFSKRFQGADIEHFANELKHQIIQDQSEHVMLMGHSRGGLIAAYFTELLADQCNITVHSVITICSPFGGSVRAIEPLAMMSDSVKEMQPQSEFLKKLCLHVTTETPEAPKMHNYLHFGANLDQITMGEAFHPYTDRSDKDNVILLDAKGKGHGHLSVMGSNIMVTKINAHVQHVAYSAYLSSKEPEQSN